MSSRKPLLALWLIVRNESKSIQASIESCVGAIDCVVLIDTGSTDDTADRALEACVKHHLPMKLYREPFVDFSTTRNRAMELASEHAQWLLMLNGDETVHGSESIRTFLLNRATLSGIEEAVNVEVDFGDITFRHPRITRAGSRCRYVGRTHEALVDALVFGVVPGAKIVRGPEDVEKKRQQWIRDEILLSDELHEDPDNPRAQFYLGQTLELLGREREAVCLYRKRAQNARGWVGECYESLLRLAEIEHLDANKHLTQAIEMCPKFPDAYALLAEHHLNNGRCWHSCFVYARRACELSFGESTLFSRKRLDLLRWDLLSASAFYAQHEKLGRRATLIAINKPGADEPRLRSTFRFYHPWTAPVPGTLVLVVGTGRSGTSVMAHILSELGVDMGPDIEADEKAPQGGYGEDRHVRMFSGFDKDWSGLGSYLAARVENCPVVVGCKSPYLAENADLLLGYLPQIERICVINCERDLDLVQRSFVHAWGGGYGTEQGRKRLEKRLDGGRTIAGVYDGITVKHDELCKHPIYVVQTIADYVFDGVATDDEQMHDRIISASKLVLHNGSSRVVDACPPTRLQ